MAKNGKMEKPKPPKKDKNRVRPHKIVRYRGSQIYIRQIGDDYFEYLVVYKGEIYSSYIIIKPKKGTKRLNKEEIKQAVVMIFAGAVTTLDQLAYKEENDSVE